MHAGRYEAEHLFRHPRYGFIGGTSHVHDAEAAPPRPSRATDANQKMALAMSKGVEGFGYRGQQVAAYLNCLDPTHQALIAETVFHLIRIWAAMAANGHGPDHPLYVEYQAALRMAKAVGLAPPGS